MIFDVWDFIHMFLVKEVNKSMNETQLSINRQLLKLGDSEYMGIYYTILSTFEYVLNLIIQI